MHAQITIKMDGAAFIDKPASELARILEKLAGAVKEGSVDHTLYDINRNTVGFFKINGESDPVMGGLKALLEFLQEDDSDRDLRTGQEYEVCKRAREIIATYDI